MKKFFVFIMTLVITLPMCAQSGDDDLFSDLGGANRPIIGKPKKNAFYLGPKIGLGLTSISDPAEGKLGDGMGMGFIGGLAFKTRFGKATENSVGGTGFWGLGLELKYKKNSAKTIADGFDENLNMTENANIGVSYFEVPIYLHVYPFAKSRSFNTLYLEAGVSLGMVLGRNPNYLHLQNPSDQYGNVFYALDDEDYDSKLGGGDIHPIVGLGYTIPKTGLDINVRYHIGTTNLASNFTSKMSTLEISFSYMFKICKF